jgi:hypothetical protein
MGSGFRVQGSRLMERFNEMKNRRIINFDFMHNTRLGLRGESGRQIFRENYLVVSAVKRAAEGEI